MNWLGYLFFAALLLQLGHIVFRTPVEYAAESSEVLNENKEKILRSKLNLLTNGTYITCLLGGVNIHFVNAFVIAYLIAFVTLI